jgi:hypothetical protein
MDMQRLLELVPKENLLKIEGRLYFENEIEARMWAHIFEKEGGQACVWVYPNMNDDSDIWVSYSTVIEVK